MKKKNPKKFSWYRVMKKADNIKQKISDWVETRLAQRNQPRRKEQ